MFGASEMAQGVKELASQRCKSDGLNSVPGTHIKMAVRTGSAKPSFDFHIHRRANPTPYKIMHVHTSNNSNNNNFKNRLWCNFNNAQWSSSIHQS